MPSATPDPSTAAALSHGPSKGAASQRSIHCNEAAFRRGREQHERADALRVVGGQPRRDRRSEAVTDDRRAGDAVGVKHRERRCDVAG